MPEPMQTSVPPLPSTALAIVDGGRFAVAAAGDPGLRALTQATELGAGVFDMTQVRVPTGGVSFFSLPDERGEMQPVKTIEAVLVAVQSNLKAWFAVPFSESGGGSQPDCHSSDGAFGFGMRDLPKVEGKAPSHQKCSECRYNQFGTSRKGAKFGKGKDCQDYALLYLYRDGDFLPTVLKASATSLQNLKKYGIFLAGRGRPSNSVITQVGLESDQSDDGIAYSKLTFRIGALLDQNSSDKFATLRDALVERVLSKFDPATLVDPAPAT